MEGNSLSVLRIFKVCSENTDEENMIYKVSASWVLELEQYNEWMSEEDYEVDDAGRKKIHKVWSLAQPPVFVFEYLYYLHFYNFDLVSTICWRSDGSGGSGKDEKEAET